MTVREHLKGQDNRQTRQEKGGITKELDQHIGQNRTGLAQQVLRVQRARRVPGIVGRAIAAKRQDQHQAHEAVGQRVPTHPAHAPLRGETLGQQAGLARRAGVVPGLAGVPIIDVGGIAVAVC